MCENSAKIKCVNFRSFKMILQFHSLKTFGGGAGGAFFFPFCNKGFTTASVGWIARCSQILQSIQ